MDACAAGVNPDDRARSRLTRSVQRLPERLPGTSPLIVADVERLFEARNGRRPRRDA